MRVLVTGAYGFVGNAVVRRLVEANHQVVALTHRPAGSDLPDLPVAQVFYCDIRDKTALLGALEGVDGVCHLAALTRVRESFERPEEYQAVNTGGTVALLDALVEQSAGRPAPTVVLGSTAAVYGAPEHQPIGEDAVPAPTNPYGTSKLGADEALRQRAESGAVKGVALRCFNIAGAVHAVGDGDESRIIPKALAVAAGRYPHLEMNGDGSAVRDFVHVDDLARAYVLALSAVTVAPYRIYNVGATAASMREIVATVERVTGRAVPVVHRPPQPEPPKLVADITRITNELGWKPECSNLDQLIIDSWSAVTQGPH
ncbi:NAD-dependent epimerase/dehydratase family protein [Streptomyces sp. H10-C2]|uniref:NAD-dependent epimerase/dehydratase family protein n=1 Tax=unclassified Streptomyces TaxID=2593676 RepID=UPI0024B8CB1C|nr:MULTISPECIES: NAD-dependent epimerase/dehydratase family protein [unclassified Streptomyces]MDJ0341371.1 NAD-dependent epimerase/dehydratase family protein [Streptomyces sp. PH10-H1]MDJ0370966.1 NAD-dependent epimerase/dehydratase family protein [Streptomyces sp. H10-C2]